ncbi:MAG: hypothetical protein GY751_12310 [Bacteroidetes bacterium]|nr:hypothetical protein [Bacteroidota bacterium]
MASKNSNLSKSTVIRSLQCQKSLYLYKNFYNLRDKISPEQQAVFDRGHRMGAQAQDLFPGGEDMSPAKPWLFKAAVKNTDEQLHQLFPVTLYEAAFRFDQVLVYLDILVNKDDKWYGYEVKSSRRISATYLKDAAIQYYVITKSGLKLEDMSIIHVREDYNPEIHQSAEDIFVTVSVMEDVLSMQEFVQASILNAKNTLNQDEVPEIAVGDHCDNPYPCDYKGTCWRGR